MEAMMLAYRITLIPLTIALVVGSGSSAALARQGTYTPPSWVPVHNIKQAEDEDDPNNEWLTEVDDYLFTLSPSATGEPAWGPAIGLADPTIVWIKASGESEGFYYITGTDISMSEEDVDQESGNFRIYKSRDLKRFAAHKFAFPESTRSYRVNRIGNSTYAFGNLHSPQLVIDPSDPGTVHLVFTATIGALELPSTPLAYDNIIKVPHWDSERASNPAHNVNPLFPWDSYYEDIAGYDEDIWWNHNPGDEVGGQTLTAYQKDAVQAQVMFQSSRYLSVYVASMSVSDFVSPDTSKVFADSIEDIRWFAYTAADQTTKYDGGQYSSPLTYVPTSGFAYGIGYQLMYPDCWYSQTRDEYNPGDPLDPQNEPCSHTETYDRYPYGMRHRTSSGAPWSWETFMVDGGFIFYDTRSGSNGAPWILYGCRNIGASSNPVFRGNHVAMARLLEGSDYELKIGSDYGVEYLHFCENQTVPHKVGEVYDGGVGTYGTAEGSGWSIAETPSAFYESDRDCYFTMFSRNTWSGPAYNVKYRFQRAGVATPTFGSIATSTWSPYEDERMLISAKRYVAFDDHVEDLRGQAGGRSYGNGEMFYMRKSTGEYALDSYGRKVPCLIFSVKFDGYRTARTVMFKRLTWSDPVSASNCAFSECYEGYKCVRQDTWKMELPAICRADVTADGVVDFGDYLAFLGLYEALDNAADMNSDCVVDFGDYLEFQNLYAECGD